MSASASTSSGSRLPRSRPQAVESSATSTSSRAPAATSSSASDFSASIDFARWPPRIDGMVQKVHLWSQPCEMRRYEYEAGVASRREPSRSGSRSAGPSRYSGTDSPSAMRRIEPASLR